MSVSTADARAKRRRVRRVDTPAGLTHVPITARSTEQLKEALAPAQVRELNETISRGRALLEGRVVWNVSSTAHGGGVAEMLHSLLGYTRGAGIDARWVVIGGTPRFYNLTKRLHNELHGADGDMRPLGRPARALYDRVTAANAEALATLIDSHDIVLVHDPQPAGLVPAIKRSGARVVWRSHVGLDVPNDLTRQAWAFLLPYVVDADSYVFSRRAYVWEGLDRRKTAIIPPTIDAFSVKNEDLSEDTVVAILEAAGILAAEPGRTAPVYVRGDGTPGRVDRRATMVEDAPLPPDAPLVVQVSRWDHLKDPVGVMQKFATHVAPATGSHLMLAGPDVTAVTDDPEGALVWAETQEAWARLPAPGRARVHLALLPMDDPEENAAIVNAIQRRASVVVQKSLAEGFGLTVAEAMWKGKPVIGTRVGGIQDQIVNGATGYLVDPDDEEAFGRDTVRLLADPDRAAEMGALGRERVRRWFLGPRQLAQYVELFGRLIEGRTLRPRLLAGDQSRWRTPAARAR